MNGALPKGIWYDAPNRRFRVRRYKNRVAHLVGYFPTLEEARAAHSSLAEKLVAIPQRKRGERVSAAVPAARFAALARAALLHFE